MKAYLYSFFCFYIFVYELSLDGRVLSWLFLVHRVKWCCTKLFYAFSLGYFCRSITHETLSLARTIYCQWQYFILRFLFTEILARDLLMEKH